MANLSFGWTKVDGCDVTVAEVNESNFRLLEDEPGKTVYIENVETAIDQKEKITITGGTIPTVANGLSIVHPNKVSTGTTFAVKVEETGRYDDTIMGTVDDPVVVQISVRSTLDSEVTAAKVQLALERALGLLFEGTTAAGSANIGRLMRGSTKLLG